jgi:cellobiose phosphorylase
LSFTTAAPDDRDQALALANRFTNLAEVDGVFEETASNEQAKLAELNLSFGDAAIFQRLAAHVLFAGPLLRSRVSVTANKLGQPALWPQAISGDLPIMLLRIGADAGLELARQVLKAQWYWHSCGLVVDLVVLNDDAPFAHAPAWSFALCAAAFLLLGMRRASTARPPAFSAA